MKTEGSENDSILSSRALSPIKELDELETLDRDSGSSCTEVAETVADNTFPGPDRKTCGLSQKINIPDASPNWILSSPRFRALRTSKRHFDIPVTPQREPASRDHVSEQQSFTGNLALPVFPRITLPRFSFSPSDIRKAFEHRLPSSELGNDKSNTEVGSAAPDPVLDDLPGSTQSGELHSTEAPSPGKVPCGGTLSMSPTERHSSCRSQDTCRAAPAHDERLDPSSTAGVMSSWTSTDTFSLQVHLPSDSSALGFQDVQRSLSSVDALPSQTTPLDSLPSPIPAHLEDRGRPTAVIGSSNNKGIDSEAGTSSSRTALGSLPSGLGNSVDQGTSIGARRRRRDPVRQSSNVTRSDLAPEVLLPSSESDDLHITTSHGSGLLLSQISNLLHVSLARKDAKTQAPKSIPRPPPSRLVPESPDQVFILSYEASLVEGDPPWCASGNSGERVRSVIVAAFADLDFGSLWLWERCSRRAGPRL
jgi:hypothetical protein